MLCINYVNYVKTLGLYANKTAFDLFFNIIGFISRQFPASITSISKFLSSHFRFGNRKRSQAAKSGKDEFD